MTNDLHFCQQIAGNPRQSFEEQLAKPCRQRRSRRLLLMLPPQAQQCRLRWHRLLSPPLLQAHQVQLSATEVFDTIGTLEIADSSDDMLCDLSKLKTWIGSDAPFPLSSPRDQT